jgi:hypothetical protein
MRARAYHVCLSVLCPSTCTACLHCRLLLYLLCAACSNAPCLRRCTARGHEPTMSVCLPPTCSASLHCPLCCLCSVLLQQCSVLEELYGGHTPTMSMSVCLSVCLSACLSTHLRVTPLLSLVVLLQQCSVLKEVHGMRAHAYHVCMYVPSAHPPAQHPSTAHFMPSLLHAACSNAPC